MPHNLYSRAVICKVICCGGCAGEVVVKEGAFKVFVKFYIYGGANIKIVVAAVCGCCGFCPDIVKVVIAGAERDCYAVANLLAYAKGETGLQVVVVSPRD